MFSDYSALYPSILVFFVKYPFVAYNRQQLKRLPTLIKLLVLGFIVSSFVGTIQPFLPVLLYKNVKFFDEFVILFSFLTIFVFNFRLPHRRLVLLLVLYCAFGIISGLRYNVPIILMAKSLFLEIKGSLLFIVLSRLAIRKHHLIKIGKILSFFFLLLFITTIFDLILGLYWKNFFRFLQSFRYGFYTPNAFFHYPSDFGWAAAMYAIFFATFGVLKYKNKLFLSSCMLISSLRLKEIVGFFLVFPFRGRIIRFRHIVPILFLIVLSLYVTKIIFPQHYSQYLEKDTAARTVFYLTSTLIAKDNLPFGVGFGRFGGPVSADPYSSVYYQYGISGIYGLEPDNPLMINDTFWPMILGESGVLGLVAYFAILWYVFAFLFKKRISADEFDHKLILFTRNVVIMNLIGTIAKPLLTRPPSYFFIFGLVGLVYAYLRTKRLDQQKNSIGRV